MWNLNINKKSSDYIFEQVRDEIIRNISLDNFDKNKPLPSINQVSEFYKISSVTIGRAYNQLKKNGLIVYVKGKYYLNIDKINRLKILLVFNKLEEYKKLTYDAIQKSFNESAKIVLQVFYSNFENFKTIINESIGQYDYYILMPHFYKLESLEEYLVIVNKIPKDKLLYIDKILGNTNHFIGSVIQNFDLNMYNSLIEIEDLIKKYDTFYFVKRKKSHHPIETIFATERFCLEYKLNFEVIEDLDKERIRKGAIYFVTTDKDLVLLIKEIKKSNLIVGKDVGILGYNETLIKEILDITVFSTNFYEMGNIVSKMIMNLDFKDYENKFEIIHRNSL